MTTLADRLRLVVAAGPVITTRRYGDGDYGTGDYGYVTAPVEDLECRVEALRLTCGRQRAIDAGGPGRLTITAHGFLPRWVASKPVAAAVVPILGRELRLEVEVLGTWLVAYTGTVERATCRQVGRGVSGEPLVEWSFLAIDQLYRLGLVRVTPGATSRPIETYDARADWLAVQAGLTTIWATPPAQRNYVQASTLERSVLAEATAALEPFARMNATKDGRSIRIADWRFTGTWGGDAVWYSSAAGDGTDHTFQSGFPAWLLPAGTEASIEWPLDEVYNDVTCAASGMVPPFHARYTQQDTASINDYGRRSYVRTDLETAEGHQPDALYAPTYPASSYATAILARYKLPKACLRTVTFDMSRVLDVDEALPVWPGFGAPPVPKRVGVGAALVYVNALDPLSVALPPDDAGGVWRTGYSNPGSNVPGVILGYEWDISPTTARLTVSTEDEVYVRSS